ncbi:MAG: class IV adenylate cyclase [Candidatus Zixiibacteriota bacterium]|nr:MAG: class IV adenylate cyclase [candidate division Zixibacteria bacterium]
MARNIEIKAKAQDFQKQMLIAESLGDGKVQHLFQEDTFFYVPSGRLKLREFGDGKGELIQYERGDSLEPAECRYLLYPADKPTILKDALTKALGIRAVVRKRRIVYFAGQTRIHFDEVEDLGKFIELEVVLNQGEKAELGVAIAEDLMKKLGIDNQDLIEPAYVDLLEKRREQWS